MSDLMLRGVILMPYDMAMRDELSRLQFHSRAQALLADCDRMRDAAHQMHALYPNVWDRADGCLVVFPENVERFDAAFEGLRAALAQEQGGRYAT